MDSNLDKGPAPLVTNIESLTLENTNYRTTLWTGEHLQVTLMCIEPGHDIGLEVHPDIDQFLRIEQGQAAVQMGPTAEDLQTWQAGADYAVVVPAGTWHNVVNIGDSDLKVYSLYSPAEHAPGTVHKTKAEADEAEAAEHGVA